MSDEHDTFLRDLGNGDLSHADIAEYLGTVTRERDEARERLAEAEGLIEGLYDKITEKAKGHPVTDDKAANDLFAEVAAVVARYRGPRGRDWLRALPCGEALDAIDSGPNSRERYHRRQGEQREAYYRELNAAELGDES